MTRSWCSGWFTGVVGNGLKWLFLKFSPQGLGSYCTHCRQAGFRGKNCGKGRFEGPSGVPLVHQMACPRSYTEGHGGITHSCNNRPALRKKRHWKPVPTVLNIINSVQKCKRMKESSKDHWEVDNALPDAIPNPYSLSETNDRFYHMKIKNF